MEFTEIWMEMKIVVRPREITTHLLDAYGFKYETLYHYNGILRKIYGMFVNDFKYFKIAKEFNPDLIVSTDSPYSAQVSAMLRKPYIAFSDTNPGKLICFTY